MEPALLRASVPIVREEHPQNENSMVFFVFHILICQVFDVFVVVLVVFAVAVDVNVVFVVVVNVEISCFCCWLRSKREGCSRGGRLGVANGAIRPRGSQNALIERKAKTNNPCNISTSGPSQRLGLPGVETAATKKHVQEEMTVMEVVPSPSTTCCLQCQ